MPDSHPSLFPLHPSPFHSWIWSANVTKCQSTFAINAVIPSTFMDGWWVFPDSSICRCRMNKRLVSRWQMPQRNDRVPLLALLSLASQIPCKHVFCYDCALLHEKKGEKMCPGWVLPSTFRSPQFNTLVYEHVTAGVYEIFSDQAPVYVFARGFPN